MKKLSENNKYLILSLPAIVLYIIVIYGIIIGIFRSFGLYNSYEFANFTTKYIKNILLNKTIIISLLNTMLISFISSILSVLIGIVISLYIIKNNIKFNKLLYIYVPIPHIVVAMMFILLFSQNGFLSRIAYHLHLIDKYTDFPLIINDKYNIGIIFSYVLKSVSYVITVIYILLNKTNVKYYEVAKSLGINFKKYVYDILLPINFVAICSSFLILFSYSFGAFEIPFLLGNTSNKLLPVLSYEKYLTTDLNKKPEFYAINFLMLIVGIIIIFIYKKLMDKINNEKYIF